MASVFKTDNIINVLIGKSVSRKANAQAYDSTNSTTFLAAGEILVLDNTGVELTPGKTVADSDWIQVVQGRGTSVTDGQYTVLSPRIYGKDLISVTGKGYSAAQEQITYIGYNGSTGSVDVSGAASKDCFVRITPRTVNGVFLEHKLQRIYQYYATSPTEGGFVAKIAEYINAEGNRWYKAEILASGAGAATTDTVTMVNGSATVTGATNVAGAAAVGDWIRVGGQSTTTLPLYKITAISGTTLTLNMPYQGTTASVAIYRGVAATIAAGNMGIKLTGLALKFSLGFFDYEKSRFDVMVNSYLGSTTLTRSQEASKGNGVYESVAELERFAMISEGALMQGYAVPKDSGRSDAVSGTNYDTIAIEYANTSDMFPISGTKPSRGLLYIFIVDGAAQSANVLGSLNPWIQSASNKFNAISLA